MLTANFVYNGAKTSILCKESDSLKEIFNKFSNKAKIIDEKMFYLYNGNKIADENKTVEQITNEKSFTILVFNAENEEANKNKVSQSTDIICPECKCNAFLIIKDYKLNLKCDQNMHSFTNILIKDFLKTQEIDNEKIICGICKKNNKKSIYNNFFYRCCICKEDICPACKIKHDKNRKVINYEEKNYICNIHNEIFICYCKTCKKNICMSCENEHDNHEIINYGKILIKDNDIIKAMKEIRKEFDQLEYKINENIKKLNIIMENIEEYYKIINDIINNYIKNKKRNYEILKNIKEIIDNNDIINDIKRINNDNKFDDILGIYNKINQKEEIIIKSKTNINLKEGNNMNNNNINNQNDIKDNNMNNNNNNINNNIHSNNNSINNIKNNNNMNNNNIIKMDKTYQLIEENHTTEINIKNPFDKLKEIYEFYKDFISKLLVLKDKKINIRSKIIDINKFD